MKLFDPRGNLIFLTSECWSKHILKRHPIMKDFKRELIETIKNPNFIYESDLDEFSELYFKKFKTKNYGEIYMMAAIDKGGIKRFVKTGFAVYYLNKGKKLLWRKK